MVVGFVGAIGVAAAVALVIVQTMPIAPAPPGFSSQSGSGKNRSFAAVADNLPRIAAAESTAKPAELGAAAATASVFATVPTGDAALAKPSIMTPPSSPTVEAAAKAEPAPGETAKIPEPRPSDSLSRDEIASLLKRGQDLIAASDLASGRLFLMRAAQAGNAEASLALAGTFDAAVLANLRAVGVQPDPAKARAWYMRAAEQGSLEAKRRLQQSALH
jgi:TPR repeat protein